jgi:outer membrane protein insertion porin family
VGATRVLRCRGLSLVFAGFLALAAATAVRAAEPIQSAITVNGNQHIGADMIRSYFQDSAGAPKLDENAVNAAIKRLYTTGFFKDIKVTHAGSRLIVTVAENPIIERLAIEGNRKIKDEDLKKDLDSKTGGPLSRAFVQSDVLRIIDVYRQHGYYDVQVVPKTIAAKDGRLDLVFEVKEGDKLGVRQVQFVGNSAFSETKLKAVVKTGITNVLSFLLNNDNYDSDKINNDRDLLRQFYLAHGYPDVRVSSSAVYDPVKLGVVVTFKIDEGQQYHFGTVSIDSAIKTIDTATLNSVVRTPAGSIYNADAIDRTSEDMSIAIARTGEPFAAVTAQTERLPNQRVINLVYKIAGGRRLYVERIDIHGNTKTHDDVIRREFDFGEGDPYNRALVDRAERHLRELGYFKTVKITTVPGSAPDRVTLDVAVEEEKTGNFFISGGYSTTDGMLAEISISDKNFLGTGDITKASVTYGEYARGFDLAFTDPWFLGQHVSAGIDLFGRQTFANSYQSFNTSLYGAKFTAGMPLNENLGVSWNYSIYNQGLSLDPALGTASLPVQQAAQAGAYWVSSIGNGITYSTLDNTKNPTTGIRAQFNNDFAGLGGAAKFARSTQDVRIYHEIAGDVVGMVRVQGGYVTPWGGQQLPLLDGFFGGPQLVRGFAPSGFGPRDVTPGTTMDNIGGNIYWTMTGELQSPMPFVTPDAQLKVALFSDTGSLWATNGSSASSLSQSQQITNSRALRSSVGAGLIWDSMFGPIRVDYAYPVAKQPFDVTQRLQFHAGGF